MVISTIRRPVSAIKRSDLQQDIFATGSNGVVYTNYVHGGEAWHGWIPLIDYSDAFPDHFTVPWAPRSGTPNATNTSKKYS